MRYRTSGERPYQLRTLLALGCIRYALKALMWCSRMKHATLGVMQLVDFECRRARAILCLVAAVSGSGACSVYGDELIDKNAATSTGSAGDGQGGTSPASGSGPTFEAGQQDPVAGAGGYDMGDALPGDGNGALQGTGGAPDEPDARGPDMGVVLDAAADKGGPLSPQLLAQHGVPTLSNKAFSFDSRCFPDELVIGFTIRAGVWTDAIAAVCSKFVNGTLGTTRALPLNGNAAGGAQQQLLCPTNFVASGVVGNVGHSAMFNVDGMTGLGIVCRELANAANTQFVAVVQPSINPEGGVMAFREDCTPSRYLTSMGGMIDVVNGSPAIVRLGGECNSR